MTPLSRAEATSHAKFSMNQAGRRKTTGIASSRSACSMRVLWVSKFGWVACAPTVERQTTFLGRAASSAVLTAVMTARASGKPGAGSNSEGGSMKTPSASWSTQRCPLHEFLDLGWSLRSEGLRIESFVELGVAVVPVLGDDRVAVRSSHGSPLGIE